MPVAYLLGPKLKAVSRRFGIASFAEPAALARAEVAQFPPDQGKPLTDNNGAR